MENKRSNFLNIVKIISKIISWAFFVILLLIAAFLLYYFIATKIYAAKGPGYEPKLSIYTIVSGSMTPTIKVYDTVINKRADTPSDLQVGDVITFISTSLQTAGTTITHRIIAIEEDSNGEMCYRTQGDANDISDQACAKFHNVIGKVVFVVPQLGRIQFFLASRAGWLLCILLPAVYIISKDIIRIIKLSNIKKTTEKMNKPQKDAKKALLEEERKKELKRKLLKDFKEKNEEDYYIEPDIKEINKTTKKSKK